MSGAAWAGTEIYIHRKQIEHAIETGAKDVWHGAQWLGNQEIQGAQTATTPWGRCGTKAATPSSTPSTLGSPAQPADLVAGKLRVDLRARTRETRTTTVVDGGEAGLWLSRVEGALGENQTIAQEPSRPSVAWRGLIELLPDSAAILASTTPIG